MSRFAEWFKRTVHPHMCGMRYEFVGGGSEAPEALHEWGRMIRQCWDFEGSAGPAALQPGREPVTAEDYAWMLDFDQKAIRPVTPNVERAELWALIAISDPLMRRIGLTAMAVLTYGVDCTCCHGWRVVVLTGGMLGLGFLLGRFAC